VDKRREKMGVVRRRQLKRSSLSEAMTKNVVRFFHEKIRIDAHQLPPRVTPTLMTSLLKIEAKNTMLQWLEVRLDVGCDKRLVYEV